MFEEQDPNELLISSATPYSPDVGWTVGPADIITPNPASNGIPAVGISQEIIDVEAVGLSIDASLISQSAESQTLSDGTGSSLPSPQILQQALQVAQNDFKGLANDPDFANKMQLPFGNSFDLEEARAIIQEFAQGDFSSVPPVKILPRAAINGANGAFDSLNNLIYVSSEFIAENTANPEAVARLLIEEIGHYIDSEINTSDSQGDEGEIFAAAVLDINLDEPELLALKAEDDRATIVLDGKVIEIEQDSSPGTATDLGTLSGTQTFNGFVGDSDPRDYYRFNISGNSDFSVSLSGRPYGFELFQDRNNNGVADSGEPRYSKAGFSTSVSNLSGLRVSNINGDISISGPLSAGTYYVQVYENGANSNYTLNLSATGETGGTSPDLSPDLLVSRFNVIQEPLDAGDSFDAQFRVRNRGSGNASSFRAGFYISTDSTITTSDRFLGSYNVSSLAAGRISNTITRRVTLPSASDSFWSGSQNYYIGMIADDQGAVSETSESNNTRSDRVNITVSNSSGSGSGTADLSVSRFNVIQEPLDAGDSFDAQFRVRNSGSGNASSFRAGFYISTDSTITTSDRFLGSYNVSSLAAGRIGNTITRRVTLPSASDSFWSGSQNYYIGMIADDQGAVSETSESNNTRSDRVNITVSDPQPSDGAGNSLTAARNIGTLSSREIFRDSVGTSDTNDYYRFNLSNNNTSLSLRLTSFNFINGGYANLALLDSNGNLVESSTGTNLIESIRRDLDAGTYYVRVYPQSGDTNYNLSLSAFSFPTFR